MEYKEVQKMDWEKGYRQAGGIGIQEVFGRKLCAVECKFDVVINKQFFWI